MKVLINRQRRARTESAVPRNDERPLETRRSEVDRRNEEMNGVASNDNQVRITLPERRDMPWLIVGFAAAFAVIFAGIFFQQLK